MSEHTVNLSSRYRPEIDGLRAIAVLPVVLFHAGVGLFSGGFVGVDVFFVISGYLITSMLLVDLQKDCFSLVRFYERRARRILPVLFFVMFATIPFAWVWMSVPLYQDFAKSIGSVLLFFSNVLFWLQNGYFDVSSEYKPLLHTWSLSIEEQFYVLFPLFLIFLSKCCKPVLFAPWAMFSVLSVLVCSSLVFCVIAAQYWPLANFYLLPSRAWELLVGACCACICLYVPRKDSQFLSIMGLALILVSIVIYDASTPFPSLWACVPVVGTALIILYASGDGVVGRILTNKVFVGVGLISYSVYLWHQPLFAFARIRYGVESGSVVLIGLAILSVVLGIFSWYFIEKPFRHSMSLRVFALVLSAMFVSLAIISTSEIVQSRFGWSRFEAIEYTRSLIDIKSEQQKSWNRFLKNPNLKKQFSNFSDTKNTKILILGDSHAKDLFNALYMLQKEESFEVRHSNLVSGCTKRINDRFNSTTSSGCLDVLVERTGELLESAEVVILTRRWVIDAKIEYYLPQLIEMLRARGKVVAIAGNTVEYKTNVPIILERNSKLGIVSEDVVSRKLFQIRDDKVSEVNVLLQKIAMHNSVIYLDKFDYICEQSARTCDALSDVGDALYFDYGHYTIAGAGYFGEKIKRSNWLNPVLDSDKAGSY